MNKETLKVVTLIAGIITVVVALFWAISGVLNLTGLSSDFSAKTNVYFIIISLFKFALAVLLGIISYFIILAYTKSIESSKWLLYAIVAYFAFEFIVAFFGMCYWGAFDSARNWVSLVLTAAGFVTALLALIGKFDKATAKILAMVSTVIGFVFAIVGLTTGATGFLIAVGIFVMLMYIVFFLYFLFDFIIENSNKATNSIEE